MKKFFYILLVLMLAFAGGCTNQSNSAVSKDKPAEQASEQPSETAKPSEAVQPSAQQTTPQPSPTPETSAQESNGSAAGSSAELKKNLNDLNNTVDELKKLFDDVDFEGMDQF